MQVQELAGMTRDELRKLAKEHDVKGRGNMTKEELVNALASVTTGDQMTSKEQKVEELNTKPETVKLNVEADQSVLKAFTQEERRKQRHLDIIQDAPMGTIVAFRNATGKVKSAKIIARSTKNKVLKLQTSYGAEFNVSYEDVVWVKSGQRWPKPIYNLLKGIKNGEQEG